MYRSRLTIAMALALLAFGGYPRPSEAAQGIPVMAFYYSWYNAGDFDRGRMWDVPVTPYQSDDRGTIQRQVNEARGAGITGFISSWMGPGNRTDKNLATLLDVSKGTDFASTIYFETGSSGLDSPQGIVSALRYVMSTYGSHPNFARVAGKPAILFWNPKAVGGPDTWQSIRSQVDPGHGWHWNVETDQADLWLGVFDGIHLFSAASWTGDAASTYKDFRSKVDAAASRYGQPKVWAAGVAPGWDNTRQDTPARVQVGREGGNYYSRRWEAALASNPDVVTITSWNEWGEGTEIEPGTSYGNQYLDITRQYTSRLRSWVGLTLGGSSPFAFKLGFKVLVDQIPSLVGPPLEDEHYAANGDSLQQTIQGLMVWRKADNWTAFTDGATTWIDGPNGVQIRSNTARFAWEAR